MSCYNFGASEQVLANISNDGPIISIEGRKGVLTCLMMEVLVTLI